MHHVGVEPPHEPRKPRGSRRPVFGQTRSEHPCPIGPPRQWPKAPLAQRVARPGIAVGCDIPKVRMPGAFKGAEDLYVPSAPDDLIDPARGVHARRTHAERNAQACHLATVPFRRNRWANDTRELAIASPDATLRASERRGFCAAN